MVFGINGGGRGINCPFLFNYQSLSIKPYEYYLDDCLAGSWLSGEKKMLKDN